MARARFGKKDQQPHRNAHTFSGHESAPSKSKMAPPTSAASMEAKMVQLEIRLARSQQMNVGLQRQLQAEKRANVGSYGWTTQPNKIVDDDEDDDETSSRVLEKGQPRRRPPTTEKASPMRHSFTTPSSSPLSKNQETPTSSGNRKRGYTEDIADEVADLGLTRGPAPAGTRKRARKASSRKGPTDETLSPVASFKFKAICTYYPNGVIDSYFKEKDLVGVCQELWDRVAIIKGFWEKRWGEDWQWEFEQVGYRSKAPCVTTRCLKKRVKWRPGCEGKYACKDCAQAGRPCFSWIQSGESDDWTTWEFRLLPLHDNDRTRPVKAEMEVRWWINSGIRLQSTDDLNDSDDSGEMDYLEETDGSEDNEDTDEGNDMDEDEGEGEGTDGDNDTDEDDVDVDYDHLD